MATSPRMTCSALPSSTPPMTPSPQRLAKPVAAPSASPPTASALRRMLDHETAAELAIVRRGEQAAVARINHLKGAVASHERNVSVLTQSLSAQHELLSGVGEKLSALALSLPKSPKQLGTADAKEWERVVAAVHQLDQQLRRGAMPSSTKTKPVASATAPIS